MNFNVAEIGANRLEKDLLKDKKEYPQRICGILKSEMKFILENYLELTNLNLNLEIVDGEYEIKIKAKAKHIKSIGTLP